MKKRERDRGPVARRRDIAERGKGLSGTFLKYRTRQQWPKSYPKRKISSLQLIILVILPVLWTRKIQRVGVSPINFFFGADMGT